MEKILAKETSFLKALWPALLLAGIAFSLMVIAYGVESVAPGVHDAFHDFRHSLGLACH